MELSGYLVERVENYEAWTYDPNEKLEFVLIPRLWVNSEIEVNGYTSNGLVLNYSFTVFLIAKLSASVSALCIILQYWLKLQFQERESLDIYAPCSWPFLR